MIIELNAWLYQEQKRKDDFLKDLDAIRKVSKEQRAENPNLCGSSEDLTKLIQKSSASYPDGKKALECVYWWAHGVLLGKDILEGFENYFSGIFEPELNNCIRKSFIDTRSWINEKLREQRIR